MSDDLREAFEDAVYQQAFVGSIQVVQTGPGESRLLADCPTKAEMCRRHEGGHYVDPTVDSAWWAWQQAHAAAQVKRADLLDALKRLVEQGTREPNRDLDADLDFARAAIAKATM